jgi:hypothetical protein
LFNDTEVNVMTTDTTLARQTRIRLWAEHLGATEEAVSGDPVAVIDTLWKAAADRTPDSHDPGQPRISRLPAVSRRSERLLGPVRGLLVDG